MCALCTLMGFEITDENFDLQKNNIQKLKLTGSETFDIGDVSKLSSSTNIQTKIKINYKNHTKDLEVVTRIDTEKEIKYFKNDGILPFVFKEIESEI